MPRASAGRIPRCRSAPNSCAARGLAIGLKAVHESRGVRSTSASAAAIWSAMARSSWSPPACSRCPISTRSPRRRAPPCWGSGSDVVIRCEAASLLLLLVLLLPIDPVAVEIDQVLVAFEGVGEHAVLQEVLEIVELLALAARDAGYPIHDQKIGLLAREI